MTTQLLNMKLGSFWAPVPDRCLEYPIRTSRSSQPPARLTDRTAMNAQISARRKLVADTQHFLGERGWSVSILHNVSEKRRKS
jgi:hypothetical protein